MDSQGGPYLNQRALCSLLGAARLCQLAMGCAVIAMVTHSAGFSGSQGVFCMAAWCFCFAMSVVVFFLDATRLYSCLPVSWENLTVTCAAFATLLFVTASVVYPLFFIQSECPYAGCEVRNFRIAVTVCSILGAVAYGAEVALCRARPGQAVVGYMATVSGLLKVVQGFVACVIFGALANRSEYFRYVATIYCVVVYAFCFVLTVVVVVMTVCRRTKAVCCMTFERFVVVCTLLEVLLYLSASVVWPVFCFDTKYGSPWRPSSCPQGKCPWDSKLVVAVFSFVNFGLYVADLLYSQRLRCVSPRLSQIRERSPEQVSLDSHVAATEVDRREITVDFEQMFERETTVESDLCDLSATPSLPMSLTSPLKRVSERVRDHHQPLP